MPPNMVSVHPPVKVVPVDVRADEPPSIGPITAFAKLVSAVESGDDEAGQDAIRSLRMHGYRVILTAKGGGL